MPRPRRLIAVAAAAGLAVVGLAATSAPSSGAVLQKVGISISSPTTVFTSTLTTTKFTVTNPSTNSGSVALFTIVVPPGVGKVSPAGVVGDGSWRQSVLPCGSTANCSSLVLVYATLPLSTSVLKPGKSVSPSISFTTPATAQALKFSFIGIGGGVFTTTDTPTLNVVAGDAADFLLTPTTSTTISASGSVAFTLQARRLDNTNSPFSGGLVRFTLGTDDKRAVLSYNGTDYPYSPANPTYVDIDLPATTTGTYPLSLKLFAAGSVGLTASKLNSSPEVKGTLPSITVTPGAPSTITLGAVTDISQNPALSTPAQNQQFTVAFTLKDQWDNPTTLGSTTASLTASLTGLNVVSVTDVSLSGNTPGLFTATFASAAKGLVLTGSIPGSSSTATTDVTGPGASALFTGNGGTLLAGNLTATFPSGTTGTGFLVNEQCDPSSPIVCTSTTTVVAVTGTFVIPTGAGSAVVPCDKADCPVQYGYTDGDHDWFCDWQKANCYGDTNEWREHGSNEVLSIDYDRPDETADPVLYKGASLPSDGANPVWTEIPACIGAGNTTIPANAYICRDLTSYHRDPVTKQLTMTVYFNKDPKPTLPGLR
ncbi:MAG: hypothetical protein U0R68_11500 [Candidatus Nanopelagicales bacterium]